MDNKIREAWLNTLRNNDSYSNPIPNLNDDGNSMCVLGALVDISNRSGKFQLTRRQRISIRIRQIRESIGYKVGSFIVGYDIRCDCDEY